MSVDIPVAVQSGVHSLRDAPEVGWHAIGTQMDHESFPPNRPISTTDIEIGPLMPVCRSEVYVRHLLRALCRDCVVFSVRETKTDFVVVTISASSKHTIVAFSRQLLCVPDACCWATGPRGSEAILTWASANRKPLVAIEVSPTSKEAKQNKKRDALTRDLINEPIRSHVLVCPLCAVARPISYDCVCVRGRGVGSPCFCCLQTLQENDIALWCCECNTYVCLRCMYEAGKFAYNRSLLTAPHIGSSCSSTTASTCPAQSVDRTSCGSAVALSEIN
jgi:hypothetical protein